MTLTTRLVPTAAPLFAKMALLLLTVPAIGITQSQPLLATSSVLATLTTEIGPIPRPTDTLGAGDLVEIGVSYCPELSHSFRVSTDGTLALPLLLKPLAVAGLTAQQVTQKLSTALLTEHILADPIVSVSVSESRSRPVSVLGAVNHPVNFQATDRTTLIEALAKAGGLSPTAGSDIIVSSDTGAGTQPLVRVVHVKDLIGGASAESNLSLRGGEDIRVPEASKIFVAGNVRKPGVYAMQSDAETTVIKAVALSSGLDAYTGKTAYIYRKRATGSERDEVQIPLRKIMKRQAPDVVLLADDIFFVPAAEGKRMVAKVLGQLAGFGQTAEAGLLIR